MQQPINIRSWLEATVKFLLRPITVMWPMVVSIVVYYCLAKLLLHGGCIELKGALPELYVTALLLSVLHGRIRTTATVIVMSVLFSLTAIEVFLYSNFKLTLANEVFQLMFESSRSETSQFLSSFVYKWSTLSHVVIPLCCGALAIYLRQLDRKKCISQKLKNIIFPGQVLAVSAITIYFIYTGWGAQLVNYYYVLCSNDVSDFEKRYMYVRGNGGTGANTSITCLGFGTKLYTLTSRQCEEVLETAQGVTVDQCEHTSPNIMLFIGESGIRKHFQIYGYDKPTTPRLQHELEQGNLIVMTDAMTVGTQTSEVMKNMLSLHSIEQDGTWTSAPMLPHIMKLSGYHVALITNQYSKVSSNVWNSTGGFFLRDERVGTLLLDYITPHIYERDESLLNELDNATPDNSPYNMTMFHVRGQHVAYVEGYPPERQRFTVKDYDKRTELSQDQKQEVAHYDNCTLYQDSICGKLFDRYADQDMVIIYVSDHGENVYDDGKTLGRVHNDYSPEMIDSQFHIPMWVWCSPKYKELHPDMVKRLQNAANHPFQIDDIPHTILELAGVHCRFLDHKRSLISTQYNIHRERMALKRGKQK